MKFNYGDLDIFVNYNYEPRRLLENNINNKWHTFITCKNDNEILEVCKSLKKLVDLLENEYHEEYKECRLKDKEKIKEFETLRDYGVKIDNPYTVNKIFKTEYNMLENNGGDYIHEPGKEYKIEDLKDSPLKEYKALSYVSKYLKELKLYFPDKLVPIEHEDDYDEYNKFKDNPDNDNKYYDYDNDDKLFDFDTPQTYACLTNGELKCVKKYILALAICKEYKISKVFDIGCNVGIQSWFFNQNKINYTGIDAYSLNVFPFKKEKDYYVNYYNVDYPTGYKSSKLRNARKNSLAIMFNSYNLMKENNTLDDEDIKLLMRYHPYLLAIINDFDPAVFNSEAVKKYCERVVTFGKSYKYKGKNVTDGYVLFIRKKNNSDKDR